MKKKMFVVLLVLGVLATVSVFAGGGSEAEAPQAEKAVVASSAALEEFEARIEDLFAEYTGPMTSRPPATGPESVGSGKRLAYTGIFMAS